MGNSTKHDRPVKIFLGDLVHTWEKTGTWTIPLNIGFVGAYAKKCLGDAVDIRLFKCPTELIEAIRTERPDVLGLAHYVWNTRLNARVFEVAKETSPGILCVGGGPIITRYNSTPKSLRRFFEVHKCCDIYVRDQGERGFHEVLKHFMNSGLDVDTIKREGVPGCISASHDLEKILINPALEPLQDLDEIPSPYLTGMFDRFFEQGFTPILETNRSCPYSCTFCAFGIGASKLTAFSEERVYADIDYIVAHSKKCGHLAIADANFSIMERDARIAKYIYENHQKNGFPLNVSIYWNKARPDRVLEAARNLGGLAPVGASLQSTNEKTLKAIKRKNLPLPKIISMVDELKGLNNEQHLFTELILGLPEETVDSHLEANRQMMDLGAEVINYNTYILEGTEYDTEEYRDRYVSESGWRLEDNAFGEYAGERVFEGQEVVLATPTMHRKELMSFRFKHFLAQFMWGHRWHREYLMYFQTLGIHPMDVIVRLAEEFQREGGVIGQVFERFSRDHALENFPTYEALVAYWRKKENFERLRKGEYGKLNYQYTYIIIQECPREFNEFLLKTGMSIIAENHPDKKDILGDICAELLRFTYERWVLVPDNDFAVLPYKESTFEYDFLPWLNSLASTTAHTGGNLPERKDVSYEFHLPAEREKFITGYLSQYASHNKNLTLRKMSEYFNPSHFFYEVRMKRTETG